jgi:arylsulfatase A
MHGFKNPVVFVLRLGLMVIVTVTTDPGTQPALADQAPARPNIIYILADDLGYGDVGCYGQDKIKTPAIDRLAAEGMRFTQHYAASTVCAPTRCCLMTGRHTGHASIRGNQKVPLPTEDVTLAELLKTAGYATACVGKWGLGAADTVGAPWRQGFDYFFGYLDQVNAHFYYPPFMWQNDRKVPFPENNRRQRKGKYSHDLMTEEAIGFIRKHSEQPFFLYLAYTIPHAENTVPEDSLQPYLGQFPEIEHKNKHYGNTPHPRASYAGMISRMDRDIARIMEVLNQLGIDQRTIVFFSSDNGPSKEAGPVIDFFNSNGPYRGIKRDLYEGGIRVPLIVRWPDRIKANTTSDLITAQWDFLATALDLAELEPATGTDGVSIAPTLLGQSDRQELHDALYWEFYEQGGKQAARMGPWKGVRLKVGRNPDGPIELYDLESDPGETQNVADQHPEIVDQISRIMKASRTNSPHFNF